MTESEDQFSKTSENSVKLSKPFPVLALSEAVAGEVASTLERVGLQKAKDLKV